MGWTPPEVTYKGYRTSEGWEIAVKRSGQPLRLLDPPPRKADWALPALTDYLGDETRAANLHRDFAALAGPRFTGDWELTARDIENILTELEILRSRWRIALTRG